MLTIFDLEHLGTLSELLKLRNSKEESNCGIKDWRNFRI